MKASTRAAGERMLVTGGGIVNPGSNVTMSLEVGSVWERCYWFRYGHLGNAREFDYCSFQLNEDTGIPSLRRCDSQDLQAMLIPVAGSPLSCSVMLLGMNPDMEGKWAVRLDTDLEAREVELTMAVSPSSVLVAVEDGSSLVLGRLATVTCTIQGGAPTPEAAFSLQTNTSESLQEDRFSDIMTESGEGNTTTYSSTFVPQMSDLEMNLGCSLVQRDAQGEILSQSTQVLEGGLDLLYPPQPQPDIKVETTMGQTTVLTVLFRCNPPPTTALWSVDCGQQLEDDLPCSVRLVPGQQDTRFNVSQISQIANGSSLASLTLMSVSETDFHSSFSLTVTNSLGEQSYTLKLAEETSSGQGSGSGSGSGSESGSGSGSSSSHIDNQEGISMTMVIIILSSAVVGVVLAITVIVMVYKRRKADDSELAPLTKSP